MGSRAVQDRAPGRRNILVAPRLGLRTPGSDAYCTQKDADPFANGVRKLLAERLMRFFLQAIVTIGSGSKTFSLTTTRAYRRP